MSNDKLFKLIHSLDQAEKRYFKQYLKRYSLKSADSIFANLFDYVVKTKTYNKEHLLKSCSYIKKNQLQNIRARLYNNILESLRAFHSEKSVGIILHQLMINVEILKHKGLFDHALQSLGKAEKISEYYERYLILEEIYNVQERVITARSKSKKHKEEILIIQNKKQNLILTKNRQSQLELLKTKGYNLFRIVGRVSRDMTDCSGLENSLKKFDSSFSIDLNSHKEVCLYYIEISNYLRMQGRFQESLNNLDIVDKFYNNNEELKKINTIDYLKLLANRIILLNMLERFDSSLEVIKSIKALGDNSDSQELQIFIFENVVFHEMEVYLYQRDFEKAVQLTEKNLLKIEKIEKDINSVNQQSKYYRIALAYFGSGELKKALFWINRILNFDKMKYRKDILSSIQMLNLLVHYELKNYGLVETRLQSTDLYLKKINRWFSPEKMIISTLRGILVLGKDEASSFNKLLMNLKINKLTNPLDKYFMAYFDFEKWLEEKAI
jgi:tetratricopeptide (TPR) repeat protein